MPIFLNTLLKIVAVELVVAPFVCFVIFYTINSHYNQKLSYVKTLLEATKKALEEAKENKK